MLLSDVLQSCLELPPEGWLYLPGDEIWNLTTGCAVGVSAPKAGMVQTLEIATVQDVVLNCLAQNVDATIETKLAAFLHYYDNDAFFCQNR